jgi:hypothetical protein
MENGSQEVFPATRFLDQNALRLPKMYLPKWKLRPIRQDIAPFAANNLTTAR